MTYFVVEPFTIETPQGSVALPTGKMLEMSEDQAAKMGGKVRLVVGENKRLPHYCEHSNCWCSEKLPGTDYPAGCVRINCKHHQAEQDTPQAAINAQGMLPPASKGDAA